MTRSPPEISEEVLQEGCYYLSKLGLSESEIASHFDMTLEGVKESIEQYESKLRSGEVVPSEADHSFWSDVKKEAEGDVKLTFVSKKGFHHAWRSELKRLDGAALLAIYEASRDFLGTDANSRFLDYPPPKGYDPLMFDREVRKAVEIVSALLDDRWKEQSLGSARSEKRNPHT